MFVSWSYDDSEGEPDDETAKHVTAFTGRCESDEDYNEEICLQGEKQKKIIVRMHIEKEKPISTILGLQDEVTLLTSKVDDNMIKYVIMLNIGSDILDDIVQVGKGSGNLTGVGFNYYYINK